MGFIEFGHIKKGDAELGNNDLGNIRSSSWFNNIAAMVDGNAPLFNAEYLNNRYSLSNVETDFIGANTLTRATIATMTDFEGLIKEVNSGEERLENLRRIENLASGNGTQTITVISGNEYQVTIGSGSDDGATVVCSNAFTGTLTGDNANVIVIGATGLPSTATTTSLTLTVTGTINELFVEDVTGHLVKTPSAFVNDFEYSKYRHSNTVTDNILRVNRGDIITRSARRGFLGEDARTNIEPNSGDGASSTITVALGDNTLSMTGTGSLAVSANTAVGTGFGTATKGTDVTFNISTAGTIDLTVTGVVDTKQIEAEDFSTSYIPTTGSAVTRNADVLTADISTVFNATEGVIYFEGYAPTIHASHQMFIGFTDGTTNNFIRIYRAASSNNLTLLVFSGGVSQVNSVIDTSLLDGEYIKCAVSYKVNEVIAAVNGIEMVTDTSVTLPVGLDTFGVAGLGDATSNLNQNMSVVRYYDKATTAAELERITFLSAINPYSDDYSADYE